MVVMVHPLAVLVAAVAAFAIGFLWHGPLFGKTWIRLMGMTEKDIAEAKNKPMGGTLAMAFLAQLVTAFVLAFLARALDMGTVFDAVHLAFGAWFGFTAPALLNGVLWEKRTVNLYLFNIAYHFAALLAASLIVVLWK